MSQDQVTPAEKDLYLIVDNYATHKHLKVQNWLKRHSRFHIQFTPTSASWLNMVERFFRDLTHNRLRRGVFRDLEELITLARQKPGELNYASIGIGSAPHLGAELFKSVAKVDITHVPYRGSSAQAITALIAGHVAMFLVGTSTAVPHIKRGALRGLAVTAGKRVDGLADVPTFAEAGLPGVDVSLWFGVLVPSGTPAGTLKSHV